MTLAWDETNSNNWTRATTVNSELNGNVFYGNTSHIDAKSKGYIINATWYIGGVPILGAGKYFTTVFEEYERGSSSNGYIGLFSMTDFGYASNHPECDKASTDLDTASNACVNNNWLLDKNYNQ